MGGGERLKWLLFLTARMACYNAMNWRPLWRSWTGFKALLPDYRRSCATLLLCWPLPIVGPRGDPDGTCLGIPVEHLLANLGCALPVIPIMLFMQPVIR